MKCPECQHENPQGVKFCGECGSRLSAVCTECGAANTPDRKFCGECGAQLRRDSLPRKFTPSKSSSQVHIDEQVATARGALEGERKQATVLFCDIANSTALAERIGAEAMHALLNRFFE